MSRNRIMLWYVNEQIEAFMMYVITNQFTLVFIDTDRPYNRKAAPFEIK